MKKEIDRGKRSKTISEVRPVKKCSRDKSRAKEVLPSHTPQNHVYE